MQWNQPNTADNQELARSASAPSLPARGGMVRFMLAIDNFDHVSLAYGSSAAAMAVTRVREVIREWLGDRAELHFESGGIFYGTLHPQPSVQAGPNGFGMARPRSDGLAQGNAHRAVNRLLINPPLVTLQHGQEVICLSISGTWAVHDGQVPDPAHGFDGGCRVPFHGALPGRGLAWTAQYRADMAKAASVLAAIDRYNTPASSPVLAYSTAGPVFHAEDLSDESCGARRNRSASVAEQLVFAWHAVRDGRLGQDVLYYEMCPQLIGADGVRSNLAELRPALERLGLAVMLDSYLVEHGIGVLEADPDVAVSVQISAQSASACARWGDVFRRLMGSRGLAARLTVAIAESANFPDFAEAIQFVSRLQAFGSAVAVDNFGLGYPVELFDSGSALLDRARGGLSGCIVLDVRMPGVSGLEVQKRLSSLDIHTPVIVVSGFADIAMAVQAMKSNAFEFLTKPFRDQDLFDAIGAAMELDLSRSLQSRERRYADQLMRNLTSREHEVFVRLCHGQVGKQIAHDLGMSEATVKVHRRSILHKMGVKHLGELILTYAPLVRSPADEAG